MKASAAGRPADSPVAACVFELSALTSAPFLSGGRDHLPGAAIGEEADAGHAGVGAVLSGGVERGDEGVVGAGDRGADAVGGDEAEVVFGAFLEAAELGADFVVGVVVGVDGGEGGAGAAGERDRTVGSGDAETWLPMKLPPKRIRRGWEPAPSPGPPLTETSPAPIEERLVRASRRASDETSKGKVWGCLAFEAEAEAAGGGGEGQGLGGVEAGGFLRAGHALAVGKRSGPYSKWQSVIALLWGLRKPRRWTLSAIGSRGPVWTLGAIAPVVKVTGAPAISSASLLAGGVGGAQGDGVGGVGLEARGVGRHRVGGVVGVELTARGRALGCALEVPVGVEDGADLFFLGAAAFEFGRWFRRVGVDGAGEVDARVGDRARSGDREDRFRRGGALEGLEGLGGCGACGRS